MEKEFNSKSFLSQNKLKKVLSILLVVLGVLSFIMAMVVVFGIDDSEGETENSGETELVGAPSATPTSNFTFVLQDYVGYCVYSYNGTDKSVVIPNEYDGKQVIAIGYAFSGNNTLLSVTIPNSITEIGGSAFLNCVRLTNVVIGKKVINIATRAFDDCSSLTNVYYAGTAEEWRSISIGSSNTALTNATRYYYSKTKPNTSGHYWHYVNGEIVEW